MAEFQPTRPLRGATLKRSCASSMIKFQPTRPLRGATSVRSRCNNYKFISTHAPLAGRDGITLGWIILYVLISTHAPLAGRDLLASVPYPCDGWISTHAPLAGRDTATLRRRRIPTDFNPRAPCGARPISLPRKALRFAFQPTRPLRGATAKVYKSLCTFLR